MRIETAAAWPLLTKLNAGVNMDAYFDMFEAIAVSTVWQKGVESYPPFLGMEAHLTYFSHKTLSN